MRTSPRATLPVQHQRNEEGVPEPEPDFGGGGRIYVIEADAGLRTAAAEFLELADYETLCFATLKSAAAALARAVPDLVIMADAFPDGGGLSFARDLRSRSGVPIIMISLRDSESDRVTALELGIDDYVTKPVSLKELVLRARGLLRRCRSSTPAQPVLWHCGQRVMALSLSTHKLRVDGQAVALTAAEWRVFTFLIGQDGAVVSRERIMDHCFQYSVEVYDRIVDTHVKNLRAKLGCGAWIETVKGFGYRFAGVAEGSSLTIR